MMKTRCSHVGIVAFLVTAYIVAAYHPEYDHVGGSWLSSSSTSSFELNVLNAGDGRQNDGRRLDFARLLSLWLYQRELVIGDFQDLNALYQGTLIQLPNTTLSGNILFSGWTVDVTDLRCQNLTIGDLEVSYARDSNQLASVTLNFIQLDFTCLLDYEYSYLFANGGGQATAITDNNNANVTVAFTSNGFDQQGPTELQVQSCQAAFNFANLNFNGNGIGLVGDLLNVVAPLLQGFIQQKTQDFACQALGKLNTSGTQLLQSVSNILEPYLNETVLSQGMLTEAELLQNATNVTLLSYQNPNGTLASAVDLLIREVGSYLGGESSSNSNNSSGGDLNVNDLIRSYVLDRDGSLTFNASALAGNGTLVDGGGAFTQTLLRLDSVRIVGLDSFTRFDFAPVDNYTLQASFTLASLSLEASFFWEIQPPDATISSPNVTENLSVQLDLGQINATASLLAAIDQHGLGSLPLGVLLNTSEILNCLISIFYNTDLTTLDVMVEDTGQPIVSGFQSSPGLARVVNITLFAVYDMYHSVLQRAIPGFFQQTVRNMVTRLLRERLQQSHCQPPNLSNSTNALVDLRDLLLPPKEARAFGGSGTSPYGGLASFVKAFIDSQLLSVNNATGLPNINDVLMARLSKDQSGTAGTFQYNGDLLTVDKTVNAVGLYAQINLQVNDARVENVVVGEPLTFLDPVINEAYLVSNTASLGVNDSLPLQLRAHVLFNLQGRDGFEINDEVELGIDIHEADIIATVLLELSENKFLSFPLSDFFNLQCWLATIPAPALDARGVRIDGTPPTAGLTALNVSTGRVGFNVSCLNCTGEAVFKTLSDNLQNEQGSQDASKSAQHLIGYATKFLGGEFLQVHLDRMITQAPSKCPHSPSYNPQASSAQYEPFVTKSSKDSIGFLVGLLVATACLIFVTSVVSLMVRAFVRRRHQKWLQTLPSDHILLIYRQQSSEQLNEKRLNELAHSMFRSPTIPAFVRWVIPVIVLANVGLFLSGHLSIAGTVSIRAEFAGQLLVVDDFYEFSIVQSAIELWNAGGKVLAVLIFLFSGVWPYTKQLATLAMWFLPPRLLPLSRRGYLFGWLDLLAKWSVIDIFFMILSLVAFRVTIASPRLSYLPANFYKVDLLVIPLWGLYANLIAQLMSQVSAHFIVHYHRRTVAAARRDREGQDKDASDSREECSEQPSPQTEPGVQPFDREGTGADKLQNHAFTRPHRGESDKLKLKPWVPSALCVATFATSVLVVLGCTLPSLSFEAQGIVGVLIRAGQGFQNTGNKNSVFSIARLLVGEARLLDTGKDYIGMISIAVLFVVTTLAVPLVQALLLVVQFLLPHTKKARSRLAVAIEVLQDWQYVDVYVISILITTSQLGNVSTYLVNPYCSSLQGALSSLAFYGLLKPDDAQCFHVQAGIDSGTYVLLAAAVLLTLLHTFVTKALAQYRRDEAAKGESADDGPVVSSNDGEEVAKAIQNVHPAPVLFTDTFRWLMEREHPSYPGARREETCDLEADYDAAVLPASEVNLSMYSK